MFSFIFLQHFGAICFGMNSELLVHTGVAIDKIDTVSMPLELGAWYITRVRTPNSSMLRLYLFQHLSSASKERTTELISFLEC